MPPFPSGQVLIRTAGEWSELLGGGSAGQQVDFPGSLVVGWVERGAASVEVQAVTREQGEVVVRVRVEKTSPACTPQSMVALDLVRTDAVSQPVRFEVEREVVPCGS